MSTGSTSRLKSRCTESVRCGHSSTEFEDLGILMRSATSVIARTAVSEQIA